jgi:glycerol-3-phosphate dehydrogenase
VLPGGDLREWIGAPQRPDVDLQRFRQALQQRHPELSAAVVERWARCYGSLVTLLLADGGPGPEVVPGVHEAELRYLRRHEWAVSLDDVLWRRTKLGLHLSETARDTLQAWWDRHAEGAGAPASPMEKAWS